MALHHDAAITHSALHYIIQDAGLTCKMLHKAAFGRDEVAREVRTYRWEHLVAEQVITVDESSKDDCTIFDILAMLLMVIEHPSMFILYMETAIAL